MSIVSLFLAVKPALSNIPRGKFSVSPIDITALILLGLSLLLVIEGIAIFAKRKEKQ